MMSTNFWLEILNGPQIGDFEGVLVGNCDGEVLRRLDEFLVGGSEKVFLSVHQMGTGSGDVWILVLWWAWWTVGCLEVPKPRLHARFNRDTSAEG